jgi:hypothetical protein
MTDFHLEPLKMLRVRTISMFLNGRNKTVRACVKTGAGQKFAEKRKKLVAT